MEYISGKKNRLRVSGLEWWMVFYLYLECLLEVKDFVVMVLDVFYCDVVLGGFDGMNYVFMIGILFVIDVCIYVEDRILFY